MISIGEFSKICHVTTRTLRHYDEIGLLKPMYTNDENNYRFYDVSQIRKMLLINKLKRYSFSLGEIKEMIYDKNPNYIIGKLSDKKNEIQKKIIEFDEIKNEIRNDILRLKKGNDIMEFIENIEVKLIETEDLNVVSSRQIMSTNEYGKYIGMLYEKCAKNKLTISGAPMSIYYDEEFNPDENDTEVAIPVNENSEGIRILKGCLCAMIEFKGSYSKLSDAYGKLTEWIDENNYEVNGAPYEKYITGPMDGKEIVTEIYFPVKKISK